MLGASRWASRPGRGTAAPRHRSAHASRRPSPAARRYARLSPGYALRHGWEQVDAGGRQTCCWSAEGEREETTGRGGANQQALRSGQAQGPAHRGKPSLYNDGVLLGGQRALNEPTKRLPDSEPLNKVSRRMALESIDGLPSARVCGHTPSRGCSKG